MRQGQAAQVPGSSEGGWRATAATNTHKPARARARENACLGNRLDKRQRHVAGLWVTVAVIREEHRIVNPAKFAHIGRVNVHEGIVDAQARCVVDGRRSPLRQTPTLPPSTAKVGKHGSSV